VDIDAQAVETTKLSLLLKVLEDETAETIDAQLSFLHERALPDLAANIKCGNSLVGFDVSTHVQLGLGGVDGADCAQINAFDWPKEFPAVLGMAAPEARRGFDAVIGNPPWGADFPERLKPYLSARFSLQAGKYESYIMFL
jgi:hypothetical protein